MRKRHRQVVAGERQWRVNDLGAKHDLLKGSLCWGHMPRHMVAEDLANGTLVELQRRAWHMRPLTFMISQRRGYSFSECETRLVEFLGNPQRFAKDSSQRYVSRKGERTRRPAMRLTSPLAMARFTSVEIALLISPAEVVCRVDLRAAAAASDGAMMRLVAM